MNKGKSIHSFKGLLKNIKSKFSNLRFIKIIGGAAVVGTSILIYQNKTTLKETLMSFSETEVTKLSALPVIIPNVKYGFALDTFVTTESKIQSDQVFTKILTAHGIGFRLADSLTKEAKKFYDFDKVQDGKPFLILSKDVATGADYFIFVPDNKRYIIFDFKGAGGGEVSSDLVTVTPAVHKNKPSVQEVKYQVNIKEETASGKVKNSLWESLTQSGLSYQLADKVEDALKYQFDLRKFKEGDEYKIIYDEEIVEGRSVGLKKLKAVYLKEVNKEKPIYAFYYENKLEKGFYSKDGLPMKDGFLKSPVKSAHISSRYNLNRLHPILGYVRPHFGTDYAASAGTPIMSVADGVVETASSTGGNGNFVKIKHVKPYQSQYLHMSRFAKGIKSGSKVKQGDIIGYVGSTGLSTGPHCCFRFWKNGNQVDHLREKLPQTSSFDKNDVYKFKELSNSLTAQLGKIGFLSPAETEKRKKELEAARVKP
jgi:murein DD-endopeptidase MepM/ murein hydrolase activator NlpD